MVKLASTDPIHYQERPFQCFVHRLLIFLFKRSENEFRISMLVVTLPQQNGRKTIKIISSMSLLFKSLWNMTFNHDEIVLTLEPLHQIAWSERKTVDYTDRHGSYDFSNSTRQVSKLAWLKYRSYCPRICSHASINETVISNKVENK